MLKLPVSDKQTKSYERKNELNLESLQKLRASLLS